MIIIGTSRLRRDRDLRETFLQVRIAELRLAAVMVRDPLVVAIASVDAVERDAAPPVALFAIGMVTVATVPGRVVF